jgi:hypothetical protein
MGMGCRLGGGHIDRDDVDGLQNRGRYSILYTIGCSPNAFGLDSVSEHFLTAPDGGCVAYIGNTVTGWTSYFPYFSILNDSIFSGVRYAMGDHVRQLRESIGTGSAANINLLGDPLLTVWTDGPGRMRISAPKSLTVGVFDTVLWVREARTGKPIEGARVCMSKPNEVYLYGRTDARGLVRFRGRIDSPGAVKVAAAKANFLTGRSRIRVHPSVSPYLALDSSAPLVAPLCAAPENAVFQRAAATAIPAKGLAAKGTAAKAIPAKATTAPSAAAAATKGSATKAAAGRAPFRRRLFAVRTIVAGSTRRARLVIRNSGRERAHGVIVKVTADHPLVRVRPGFLRIKRIDGLSAAYSPYLAIRVHRACPNGTVVRFRVRMTSREGAWSDDFALTVRNALVRIESLRITDGDGDGIVEPGEEARVRVLLKNAGRTGCRGVEALLGTRDRTVTLVERMIRYDALPPGTSSFGGGDFVVRFGKKAPGEIEFTIHLRHKGKHLQSCTLTLIPPAPDPVHGGSVHAVEVWDDSVALAWEAYAGPSAIVGYNIYRVDPKTGVVTKLNNAPVDFCYFRDEGLRGFHRYLYRVCVVDAEGREWAYQVFEVWTTLPYLAGWPIDLRAATPGAPCLADVNGDGHDEIFAASGNLLYGFTYDCEEIVDLDQNPTTITGFARLPDGSDNWSSPVICDLDGDGDLEVIQACCNVQNGAARGVYAYHHDGTLVAGWPVHVEGLLRGTPAVADIIPERPGLEVFVGDEWTAKAYLFHADGTLAPGWPVCNGDIVGGSKQCFLFSSPVACDIDRDGALEILISSGVFWGDITGRIYAFERDGSQAAGFPYTLATGQSAPTSPAVFDIDGDGFLEIITMAVHNGAGSRDSVRVLEHDGTLKWEVDISACSSATVGPAVVKTADGVMIFVPGKGCLYGFRPDGTALAGYPVSITGECGATPAVANVDGDDAFELVVPSSGKLVYAFDLDGSPVLGWPIRLGAPVSGSAKASDLDGDGKTEIVVCGGDCRIHIWKTPGLYRPLPAAWWGSFHRNNGNTGFYGN